MDSQQASLLAGAVITGAGLAALFLSELYVAGAVLTILSILITVISFRHHTNKPFRVIDIRYTIRIVDKEGKMARVIKEKTFKVLEKNIDSIVASNFTASGSIQFVSCEPGKLSQVVSTDGAHTTTVNFPHTLPIGSTHSYRIYLNYIDTFIDADDQFSVTVDSKVKGSLTIEISFPPDRRCQRASSYMFYEGRVFTTSDPVLEDDNSVLRLTIARPKMGARYALGWKW